MESFKLFVEAFTNQDRQKFILQSKLQQISNALINMQMIEKDSALGTPGYIPPEYAKGLKTDSPDSWQMMTYALKGHPEQKTAQLLQSNFQKLMWGWDKFINQAKNDYDIDVDTSTVQEAFDWFKKKPDPMKRIIKHSYDAVNRQQLNPVDYSSLKPTPASLRMGRQRREELAQAKKAYKSGMEPNALGYIQREQAEELRKKYFTMQSAISSAAPVITQFLESNPTKSTSLWKSFLNYETFWNNSVKTSLPRIINALPKRPPVPDVRQNLVHHEPAAADMAPTIDYRHD